MFRDVVNAEKKCQHYFLRTLEEGYFSGQRFLSTRACRNLSVLSLGLEIGKAESTRFREIGPTEVSSRFDGGMLTGKLFCFVLSMCTQRLLCCKLTTAMVQFSLKLADNRVDKWSSHYLDYKSLKETIAQQRRSRRAEQFLEAR